MVGDCKPLWLVLQSVVVGVCKALLLVIVKLHGWLLRSIMVGDCTAFWLVHAVYSPVLLHFADATREMPHFSSAPLVLQFAHKEQLTFSYYLRHGRASFAFTAFVSDHLNTRTIAKSR